MNKCKVCDNNGMSISFNVLTFEFEGISYCGCKIGASLQKSHKIQNKLNLSRMEDMKKQFEKYLVEATDML